MGQCPVCNAQIEANFGPAQCSQCQSALFIDFAGNIIVGGDEEAPSFVPEGVDQGPEGDIELGEQDYHLLQTQELEEKGVKPPEELFLEPQNFFNDHQELTPNELNPSPDDPPIEVGEPNPIFESKMKTSTEASLFRIIIREIDTASLRRMVLDSLQDPRLGLVQNEIANKIQDGTLEIQGLNPIKASFIMNTLKDLPLLIEWEVYETEKT